MDFLKTLKLGSFSPLQLGIGLLVGAFEKKKKKERKKVFDVSVDVQVFCFLPFCLSYSGGSLCL
jgi:hypothetical protein